MKNLNFEFKNRERLKMKYLMILFSFCCSLAAETSMDRYYKVRYDDKFKTLYFEEKFDGMTNEKSEIDLIMPFGVVYKINSLEIKKDGVNSDASFKKKSEVINIKIKDSANSIVNVHIKYRIIMSVKKPFLLAYNYLYFPLDLLKKPALYISDDLIEINWTADFMLPPGWVLISP